MNSVSSVQPGRSGIRPWVEAAALLALTLVLWVVPAMVSQGNAMAPVEIDRALPAHDRVALSQADALALALAASPADMPMLADAGDDAAGVVAR
ncbi:hypothetical protein [Polymorphobacter sp.]|uniref:hypothetical protein n=1 Tax=Polymorphobacter sp. TaxID=1909290 RepID=UPI003F72E3CE